MKKISRNIKVFLLSDVFYYSSYDLINAFLTVLITTKVTDGRLDLVGIALGYYMLLRALAEFPFSKLLSGMSTKAKINFVSVSHVIYGFVIAGMGFSSSLGAVFAFLTVTALIDASTYPIKWALFSKMLDKGNEEAEWSMEDIFATLASAVFAVLGGFMAEKYGISYLFVVMGLTFSICGIIFHFIRADELKLKVDASGK